MQYGEVAMETPGKRQIWTPNYKKIENIINKKSYEPARAFRDLCCDLNQEMHSRSYDFLYVSHEK